MKDKKEQSKTEQAGLSRAEQSRKNSGIGKIMNQY